ILFFTVTVMDYQLFYRLAYFVWLINLGAIVAVMLVGESYYGAQRWLHLGFFAYQPTETMKLALVLVLARYFSQRKSSEPMGYGELFWPVLITGIPFALTVKQPDLGTGLLMAAI